MEKDITFFCYCTIYMNNGSYMCVVYGTAYKQLLCRKTTLLKVRYTISIARGRMGKV